MVRPAPAPLPIPERKASAPEPVTGPDPGAAPDPPRVAIVGTSGSGKSLLFQRLAGRGTNAGAAYGTATVESERVKLGGREVLLLDTPGTSGLELSSEHDAVTRELLRERRAEVIVQCVDAEHLARSLTLTAQLADLELPMVVCVTMVDQALERGQLVDADELGKELGVPVVPVCALDGRGLRRLSEAISAARPARQVSYPGAVQGRLDGLTPIASRAHRVERVLASKHPGQLAGQSLWHMVHEAHLHWARELAARATRSSGLEPRRSAWTLLAAAALHPLGSWLFLGATLAGVYLLISRIGAGLIAVQLEQRVEAPIVRAVSALLGEGTLEQVLVGPFGLLTLGLLNGLCTVLPILLLFHLAFATLEEVGYFPLLAVQFDRLLRSIGLTGKAVLPITLGFGCNALAVQSTRCLESPRQRLIACFLISLGIPCAVQLGVLVSVLASVPLPSLLVFVGVVVGLEIVAGRLLAAILPTGERGEFLVELKPLRAPRVRAVLARTAQRLLDYFRELCPLFLASAAVLQALQWTGLLERIRQVLRPVVVLALGLPAEMSEVLLTALARRDVAALMTKGLVDRGAMSAKQVLVGLVVLTLFVPCLNAAMVLGRVLGVRRALVVFVCVLVIALLAGSAVNLLWG